MMFIVMSYLHELFVTPESINIHIRSIKVLNDQLTVTEI